MLRRIVFSLLAITSFFFASGAYAQTLSLASDVSVSLIPEHPGPNENVTVQLVSYSTPLENAFITWSVDGRTKTSAVGADRLTITTKGIGTATAISATISPLGETPILKTITISPAAVDMLWEATDAIVPPFYRGKALPTNESTVRFTAIPQVLSTASTFLSPSSFAYAWKENYMTKGGTDGYAKNTFLSEMDYLNPTKHVAVEVSGRDGAVAAANSIDLTPVSAKILWYAASPLYGPLFGTALSGSYSVAGSDTSLVAEPYFFSPGDPSAKTISYQWELNGTLIDTPAIPNSLFLHRESKDTGTASVSVAITSLNKLFQEAAAQLSLSLE